MARLPAYHPTIMKTKGIHIFAAIVSTALAAAAAPAGERPAPVTKDQLIRGRQVYQQICFSCHQLNGQGIPGTFPPLADSDLLLNHRGRAITTVLQGLQGPVKVNGRSYNNVMPNLNLSNRQVADVLTYVSNSWGNQASAVTAKTVAKTRKLLAKNSLSNRSGVQTAQNDGTRPGPAIGNGMMNGGMMGGGMMGGGMMGGHR